MPVLMQKLGVLARVFDVGATNKSRVRTCADASKVPRSQRPVTPKKWVIAGLR